MQGGRRRAGNRLPILLLKTVHGDNRSKRLVHKTIFEMKRVYTTGIENVFLVFVVPFMSLEVAYHSIVVCYGRACRSERGSKGLTRGHRTWTNTFIFSMIALGTPAI